MSLAYHALTPTDPHVDTARRILGDRMTSTGFGSYRHK